MSTFEGEALIPSHDALCAAHQPPKLSSEARRLFWNINGSLESAVHIMATEMDTSSLEPYFQNHAWHPFSQAALTEPKVSSMTVVVDDLNEWEDMWLECHREHTDPECADEVEEGETDPVPIKGSYPTMTRPRTKTDHCIYSNAAEPKGRAGKVLSSW